MMLAATAGTLGDVRRFSPGQKLFAAMFAAEIIHLPIAFGVESRFLVHRHAADGINCHINVSSSD
jgi:hypothetical protein